MKTISIRDEVYNKLVEIKEEGESFSDVIEKLLRRKTTNIRKYFGILKDSDVLNEIERCLEARRSARFRV